MQFASVSVPQLRLLLAVCWHWQQLALMQFASVSVPQLRLLLAVCRPQQQLALMQFASVSVPQLRLLLAVCWHWQQLELMQFASVSVPQLRLLLAVCRPLLVFDSSPSFLPPIRRFFTDFEDCNLICLNLSQGIFKAFNPSLPDRLRFEQLAMLVTLLIDLRTQFVCLSLT
jgi:hypothetical protein